jgi:quercetin 2,3-dioxygenase
MIVVRKTEERGYAEHGWLKSHHTFSFADYYDPAFMGFRSLRVINEDRIEPGQGFATHGHKNMEIISYVISGGLEHKDSMGNGSIITPGEIQYLSAGSGVRHSEYNPSKTDPGHFLQIWIMPSEDQIDQAPRYAQVHFSAEERTNKLRLVVTGDLAESKTAIHIRQNAKIYASILEAGQRLEYAPPSGRGQWLQVVSGELEINGHSLQSGDAVAIENEPLLKVQAQKTTEFLLFDLA